MDWSPVLLSLRVGFGALLLVAAVGVPLALVVARRAFPGRELLDALLVLPLVLPPVVTGLALLWLLGRRGPIGGWLESALGVSLVFTLTAATLAAAVVSFPLLYQSARAAFAGVDPRLEDAARTLGAGEWRVFRTVTLPLAWPGVAAGAVLTLARALGEFGATVMVAGSLPGETLTAPLAIYAYAEAGDLRSAGAYALLLAGVSVIVVVGINVWSGRGRGARSAARRMGGFRG